MFNKYTKCAVDRNAVTSTPLMEKRAYGAFQIYKELWITLQNMCLFLETVMVLASWGTAAVSHKSSKPNVILKSFFDG